MLHDDCAKLCGSFILPLITDANAFRGYKPLEKAIGAPAALLEKRKKMFDARNNQVEGDDDQYSEVAGTYEGVEFPQEYEISDVIELLKHVKLSFKVIHPRDNS